MPLNGDGPGMASCDMGGIFRIGHMAGSRPLADAIGHLGDDLGESSRELGDQKFGFSDGPSVDMKRNENKREVPT